MAIIALTGGICSGKSVVTQTLETYLPIIDADIIARNLLAPAFKNLDLSRQKADIAQIALHNVISLFGTEILTPDNYINRQALRKLIFDDDCQIAQNNKEQLDAILHPLVYQEIWQQVDKLKQYSEHILIAIPLLVETLSTREIKDKFDQVWVIDCEEKQQIERCLQRDNSEETTIRQIIQLQASRENRLKIADHVIQNNSTVEQLIKTAKQTCSTLMTT